VAFHVFEPGKDKISFVFFEIYRPDPEDEENVEPKTIPDLAISDFTLIKDSVAIEGIRFEITDGYSILPPESAVFEEGGAYRLVFEKAGYRVATEDFIILTPAQHTVTFAAGTSNNDLADITGTTNYVTTATATEGVAFMAPVLSSDGYTFDGWFTDAACTQAYVPAEDAITEDITLYAKFTTNLAYSIKFQYPQADQDWGTHVSWYDGLGMSIMNYIVKTGTGDITNLHGQLTGANPEAFILDLDKDNPWVTMLTEERYWNDFRVYPKDGLSSGTYTATVTFTADHGVNLSFNVKFAVVN